MYIRLALNPLRGIAIVRSYYFTCLMIPPFYVSLCLYQFLFMFHYVSLSSFLCFILITLLDPLKGGVSAQQEGNLGSPTWFPYLVPLDIPTFNSNKFSLFILYYLERFAATINQIIGEKCVTHFFG